MNTAPAKSEVTRTGTTIVLARVAALIVAFTSLPLLGQALDFNYTTNNGAITITGYTGPGGAVAIPDTIDGLPVTQIGPSAFYSQLNLTSVMIAHSVTNIGDSAFGYCTSLTNVSITNSLISIERFAFFYCIGLTHIAIPNGVTSIGDAAFADCVNLTNVTIPQSVTSIGPQAFYYCTSMSAMTVDPLNLAYSSVDGVLFNKGQTTLYEYPGGKSGDYTIPAGVTSIGGSAFQSCDKLTGVIIANSVTEIGYYAFYGCTSLTGVTIPDRVASIGNLAFSGCTGVTNFTIPESVTNIGYHVFTYCTSLTGIAVDEFNPAYCSADGVLFNKNQTTLIQFPGGKVGSYSIPDTVISIGDAAFWFAIGLTSVTLPSSVTSIGEHAFSGCTNIINVTIPSGVTYIGSYAFNFCGSLMGIYFLGAPPVIGYDPFHNDHVLTVYYVPETTGWGPTFGGVPTALWRPQVQMLPLVRVGSGWLVRVNGFPEASHRIQRAVNLSGPWRTLTVVQASSNGVVQHIDLNPPSGGAFYRALSP